jgi:hypothetical protein
MPGVQAGLHLHDARLGSAEQTVVLPAEGRFELPARFERLQADEPVVHVDFAVEQHRHVDAHTERIGWQVPGTSSSLTGPFVSRAEHLCRRSKPAGPVCEQPNPVPPAGLGGWRTRQPACVRISQ